MFVDNPALNSNTGILVHRVMVDDVAINASPVEVKSLTIYYSANKHDQAVLTTKLTKSQAQEFLNQPISVTYGPLVKRETFNGYVDVIKPSRKYQEDLVYDIVCLGVTQIMQTGQARFWSGRSAPSVAADIVSSHSLGFVSDDHTFTWPSISQTSSSDWEMVNSLASMCGYVVVVNDGVVRFVDAEATLRTAAPIAHLIKGDQVLDSSRELLDFTPAEESTSLRKNTRPTYAYFDKNGNVGTTASSDAERYRMVTKSPILSKEMAAVYEKAWERNTEFWVESAKARIKGNARISPGDLVAVSLSSSSVVFNDYDGLWFVVAVTHSLTHNSFQTDLVLARDKVRVPSNTEYKDFYSSVTYGKPRLLIDSSTSTKKWKSSWPRPVIRPPAVGEVYLAGGYVDRPWVSKADGSAMGGKSSVPGPQGPRGPQGPQGPQGVPGIGIADIDFVHNQTTPNSVWNISHDLPYNPSVTLVDSAGDEFYADNIHHAPGVITITLMAAQSGTAYLS